MILRSVTITTLVTVAAVAVAHLAWRLLAAWWRKPLANWSDERAGLDALGDACEPSWRKGRR